METAGLVSMEDDVLSDLAVVEQRASFGLLLDASRQLGLRDASLRLFASSSTKLQPDEARKHTTRALGQLRKAVQRASSSDLRQDVQAMADACHSAWVLTAALHEGAVCALPPAAEMGRRLIDEAAFLLSALCLEGPSALRPALFPCIGLLVRGRGHMLSLHPSLMESLRAGLSSPSRAVRMRAVQTVTSIVTGPPGEHGTNGVMRQVATLQPELLSFLAAEVPPAVTSPALAVLQALTDSAAVDPRAALPRVLMECLAGSPCNGTAAQQLLRQLVAIEPKLLSECLPSGLQGAVDLLTRRDVGPAQLLRSFSDNASSVARVSAVIRTQLSEELRSPCVSLLLQQLARMRGVEDGAACTSLPLLGALLFCFICGPTLDGGDGMSNVLGLCTLSASVWQDAGGEELPLGTCVARLIIAALSELKEAASSRSSIMSRLAAALEELDVEEVPLPGSRATLLASWTPQLMDSGAAAVVGDSVAHASRESPLVVSKGTPSVNASTPAELPGGQATTPVSSGPVGAPSALEPPWFAEYDATCGKWRCRLCALIGGKNGYAKGIAMDATLVPMRMRIHARAAIHKQAEARHQQAAGEMSVQNCAASARSTTDTDISSGKSPDAAAANAAVTGAPESGITDLRSSKKLARAASSAAVADVEQPEAKQRRLCGQPFSHDGRSCELGAVASALAEEHSKGPHLPRLSAVAWVVAAMPWAAPKVATKKVAEGSEPWQQLTSLCRRSSVGGA